MRTVSLGGVALVLSLAWGPIACRRGAPPAGPKVEASRDKVAEATRKAGAAAERLMKALVTKMLTALASGRPEDALDVCAGVAQKITGEIAKDEGLYLRRTALRLRNPENAPDDYERAVLERWESEATIPADASEVVATAGGGKELRYLRPIVLMKPCTNCHGPVDSIRPAVRAKIREHYPEDRAVDFRPGDLRGAITVRVPIAE